MNDDYFTKCKYDVLSSLNWLHCCSIITYYCIIISSTFMVYCMQEFQLKLDISIFVFWIWVSGPMFTFCYLKCKLMGCRSMNIVLGVCVYIVLKRLSMDILLTSLHCVESIDICNIVSGSFYNCFSES